MPPGTVAFGLRSWAGRAGPHHRSRSGNALSLFTKCGEAVATHSREHRRVPNLIGAHHRIDWRGEARIRTEHSLLTGEGTKFLERRASVNVEAKRG
jgi:hypothetical protein